MGRLIEIFSTLTKGVTTMKQKRVRQLIDNSGVLGFEFDNDKDMYTWEVTPANGKMLARRTIESCDDSFHENLIAVPYDDIDACEAIYQEILLDFIDCYAEDLFFGSAESLALFSDIASKGDDGLLELLSFFGKTYDEFLLDVFYWYGVWVEAKVLEGDSDCEECAVADSDESDYIHLVKSVLRHLCEDTLCIEYDSELCTLWEFAVANGGVWYRRYDTEMVDDITFFHEEFGCVMQDDPDGMAALRDAVLTCFCEDSWYYEEEGDALGLLGIKQEELFDLD